MRSESVLELWLVDAFWLFVGFDISVSPICSGSNQLMCSKHNYLSLSLSVVALNHLQLLLNGL
jgi:hypothetical protein